MALGWGVVGTGTAADRLVGPGIAADPDSELVAVVSRDEGRAKEFAAKHGAVWPATLRSTYWRAWHEVSIGRHLDRHAFAPPPSVDAAVLQLRRRTEPQVPLELHEAFGSFIRRALSATVSAWSTAFRCSAS